MGNNFKITSGTSDWETVKKATQTLAYEIYAGNFDTKKADAIVGKIFDGKTEVTAAEIAKVLDANQNGSVDLNELDDAWNGSFGCATYDYDNGADEMFSYYCVHIPQQSFNAFAKTFSDRGGDVLDHISGWKEYDFRTYAPDPTHSNEFGNNLPTLIGAYQPLLDYYSSKSAAEKK